MTRRERLERKLEKRRDWESGRRHKAAGEFARGDKYRGDVAFNTQPGHIPERARVIAAHDRGVQHLNMADHHATKADGLERQLEGSIYSDDPDAVEALTAKAEALEAEADRMAAANKAFRKLKAGDEATRLAELVEEGILTNKQALAIADTWNVCPYHRGTLYPAYSLSNTRANARRCRERIKIVTERARKQAEAEAAPGGVVVKRLAPCQYSGTVYAVVTFAEKPSREVLNALKAAGYYWGSGSWTGDAEKLPPGIEVEP